MSDQQKLEQLQAENAALRLFKEGVIKRKKDGAIQVYGIRDTPITLVPHQWKRLIELAPSISIMLGQ
jgi:hypothetical protein